MKKSLVALAVLASTGAAFAQSSVTLFGIVDAAYARVSGNGASRTGITNSGLNSSRFGMRGSEDLGGGLKAAFHLEGALSNDDGNAAGLNFQRRSTLSLMGGFGEVRIGRDYTPSFWNTTVFDPFGTNGVGSSNSISLISRAGGANSTAVRSDNSIGYFLPGGLGGLYGQFNIGFGEQVSNGPNPKTNNYQGFRLGFNNGPLNTAFGYGKVRGNTSPADVSTTNFGVSYNLGVATPMFVTGKEKNGTASVSFWQLGAVAPMGAGEIRASYGRYNPTWSAGATAAQQATNPNNDWTKFAVGYGYNLSKRTQLYTTYARTSNGSAQAATVSNNGLAAVGAALGGNATGFEAGVRHSF